MMLFDWCNKEQEITRLMKDEEKEQAKKLYIELLTDFLETTGNSDNDIISMQARDLYRHITSIL